VGYGAKSIVRMKAILPNSFVLLLDDTPEDHLSEKKNDIVVGKTFSLVMIQTPSLKLNICVFV